MEKTGTAKKYGSGVRKFVTGESRYCQSCGKESYWLFEIIQDVRLKNKLQYCKQCFNIIEHG
ncbi:MAG TPA: hypothetical protein VJG65_02250 [Patescibacteria group bacterium]|nr:hypothetical protein [Patescibacteria group bacterium]